MSDPYRSAKPGDAILAETWNQMQRDVRNHVISHAHTGDADSGVKLTGDSIARESTIEVEKISATSSLSVRGIDVKAKIDALTADKLSVVGGTISGPLTITGLTTIGNVLTFAPPPGDSSPTITTRTIPDGQGAANERTELILFHGNDGANGAGPDAITLRAPEIRLQTYDNAAVSTIDDNAGSNDRLVISPSGEARFTSSLTVNSNVDVSQGKRSGDHRRPLGLYVTGDFSEADGVEFRHSNATQGIGIGYNTIYATGTNGDQDLQIKARGKGTIKALSNLSVSGQLSASSLSANAIDSRWKVSEYKVAGDNDKFYPIVFNDVAWNDGPFELHICRPNTHTDASWFGSLISVFRVHSTNWGHGSEYLDVEIYSTKEFIGGYQNASQSPQLVVWLRGGTTYYFRANCQTTWAPGDAATVKKTVDGYVRQGKRFSNGLNLGDNQSLRFGENGEISSFDDKHRLLFRRSENILELREFGSIILSAGATSGAQTETVNVSAGTVKVNGGLNVSGDLKIGANYATTNQDAGVRVIFGFVNSDGVVISGKGFSVTKEASGFRITFTTAFSVRPCVMVTQHWNGSILDNAVVYEINQGNCLIKTGDATGNASFRHFCFVAIGN